jgi:nickel/cobalt transporter (NicO) family protein
MTPFADLVQQGAATAWLFIPTAILLGALHGLEPGHSKTMMAAFIIAIRGTMWQAAVLAISATVSHTAIVWLVAILALTYGSKWSAETTEPYFQLASGLIIIAIAAWMLIRTWRDQQAARRNSMSHHQGHEHAHNHGSESHGGHGSGVRDHSHSHGHSHVTHREPVSQDTHEREHAAEMEKHFGGRSVTTGQVVLFGLTGGLLPCPGAVTVLLLCLQMREVSLGVVLVLCFSVGLAITLLISGAIAAWSVHHASRRWSGFETFVRRLPYLSSAVIICLGIYVGYQGWSHLA